MGAAAAAFLLFVGSVFLFLEGGLKKVRRKEVRCLPLAQTFCSSSSEEEVVGVVLLLASSCSLSPSAYLDHA